MNYSSCCSLFYQQAISQTLGQKTYMNFKGTPTFVSPEMRSIFSLQQKKNYINLYYNDMHCLKKSVEVIGL